MGNSKMNLGGIEGNALRSMERFARAEGDLRACVDDLQRATLSGVGAKKVAELALRARDLQQACEAAAAIAERDRKEYWRAVHELEMSRIRESVPGAVLSASALLDTVDLPAFVAECIASADSSALPPRGVPHDPIVSEQVARCAAELASSC